MTTLLWVEEALSGASNQQGSPARSWEVAQEGEHSPQPHEPVHSPESQVVGQAGIASPSAGNNALGRKATG